MFADVGAKGRISDSGVLRHTRIYPLLENGTLHIPPPRPLPADPSARPIPYFLLGDKAFALSNYCMRPFSENTRSGSVQRIFNQRHSRARRSVEMAFGILSSRFRVLKKTIELEPAVVSKVVLAAVYLHNFIRRHGGINEDLPREAEEVVLPAGLSGIAVRSSEQLINIRLHMANVFATE